MKQLLLIAALLAPTAALAAIDPIDMQNQAAAADSSRVVDLDAVVVVAQPKEGRRLRQQPLASTLFSGREIGLLGTRDLRELSQYVPSFTMPNYGSRYTSALYVRGIGSRTGSPSVGMYVDGIPLVSGSQYNAHLYQTDRVDFLRGPQGTLYGMNTEGGLVRTYSPNPMHHQGFDLRLSGGTRGFYGLEASASQKVSERVGVTLAGFAEHQEGFFRNSTTGSRADRYTEGGLKARMVWEASDRLSLDFVADFQHMVQNGFPYGLLDPADGSVATPASNRDAGYRRNMLTTGLNLKYAARGFDLFSTTSYQHLHDNLLMDIDYTAADRMHMEQRQNQNAVTEELTLRSRSQGRWQWTLGGFFSYRWLETVAPVVFHSDFNAEMQSRLNTMIPNLMLQAMIDGGMPAAVASARVAAMAFNMHDLDMGTVPGCFRTPQMNLGLLHESTFALTDRLKATLGLRYDLSRQQIDYATSACMTAAVDMMVKGAPTTIPYDISTLLENRHHSTAHQLLPKVGLTFDVDDSGSNVYATLSKGYRAGGYNIQNFSDIFQTQLAAEARSYSGGAPLVVDNSGNYENVLNTISYEPETSWNYEVGTHLNLFQQALQLDLAAYFIQIRNQQLSQMASNYGFGRSMVNAGRSSSYGLEASLRGRLFENRLSYGLSYGLTRAVFREYDDRVDGALVSYRGNRVPYIPMHTFAAHADWDFHMSHGLLRCLTVGANVTGQGRTYWDNANTQSQAFHAVLGAHADFDFDLVRVSLWGRNLTNSTYTVFAVQNGTSASSPFYAQVGNPIQCGIDLNFHF